MKGLKENGIWKSKEKIVIPNKNTNLWENLSFQDGHLKPFKTNF